MITLVELLMLGVVQGIVEWLPISSEGQVVLLMLQFLALKINEAISIALFLHLGTMFVVLLVYRRDFKIMVRYVLNVAKMKGRNAGSETESENSLLTNQQEEAIALIKYFFWGILGSALTGIPVLLLISEVWMKLASLINVDLGSLTTLIIGILLVITGFVLSRQQILRNSAVVDDSLRRVDQLTWYESLIVGMCQGLAILPGISRSGMTITALLLLKVKREESLRGSFLLSVPAFLGAVFLEMIRGQIQVNMVNFTFQVGPTITLTILDVLLLLGMTFLVGYATIQYFLRQIASDKIRFDHFCYVLGAVAMLAGIGGIILSL